MRRHSWHVLPKGVCVYRRRARLVVWSDTGVTTVAPYDLYWCPSELCTFARLSVVDGCGTWLRMSDLVGHWSWLTETISDLRVLDGYADTGQPMPEIEMILPSGRRDPDTGREYWTSDIRQYMPVVPRPMEHA